MPFPTIIPLLANATRPAPLPTPDWTPWALIVAGAALLAVWGYGKKRASSHAGETSLADRLLGRVKTVRPAADASALASDLEELTDRLCARLDEKASKLESLLAQAENAIARLDGVSLERPAAARTPVESREVADEPEISGALGALGAPGASGAPLIEVARIHRAPREAADPVSRRIYELADEGRDALDIARSLDEQVGKVQLILALRGS